MKDLPTELPAGLAVIAVPKREDPRDVLVSATGKSLTDLPSGARLGTASLRRRAQLLFHRPDLSLLALRGNVDTRLRKLDNGEVDGLVMAAAGLIGLEEGPKRLQEDHTRAARLAMGVSDILPKALPEPEAVETNMVYVDVESAGMPLMATIDRLADEGLKTVPVMGNIRMVTHVDISDEDIDQALTAWRSVVEG
jgi:hypothetical protein